MEAHDGISAKIAKNAGFRVLWASGLTISAALGHRDCNEISWTDLAKQVETIVEASNLPVLVDGDTGFGNFNNVRQLVKRLCKYSAAGVCLEDKLFPKTNSFLPYNQVLASIEEFAGKIKAAKDTADPNFCVIARTESFIAGLGLEEALRRGEAYKDAGADALLIHSKESTPIEIERFCKHWDYSIPLVIVPTKYAPPNADLYHKLGISLVIWANHLLRASILAMQKTAASIQHHQSCHQIEKEIAPLNDIFNLVDEEELKIAEMKYLPHELVAT